MELTERLLNKDSIGEMEEVFGGKHHSQFDEKEQLLTLQKCIMDNKRTSNHLKSIGDTHFGMSWNEFKEIIKEYGFEIGLSYNFVNRKYNEEATLFYHKEKGLIIWATTYGEDSVNGGTLYGQVKINENNSKNLFKVLNCSHDSFGWYDRQTKTEGLKDAIYFDIDVREGLVYKLNKINEVTEFANPWITTNKSEKPRMYLYDFVEDDQEGFTFKSATMDKINRANQEVKNIIGEYNMR